MITQPTPYSAPSKHLTIMRTGLGHSHASQRRGAAAILGLILTGSLVMLLAISLDYGYINVSQAELRRSVDATAMAACWELYDQQTQGTGNSFSLPS